jgi:enoyl-CoA hydratase
LTDTDPEEHPLHPTCFDVSVDHGVAHIRLNRPQQFNSMAPAFWAELPNAITRLEQTGETRVAVISAEGPHFCAGMDLEVFENESTWSTATSMDRERFRQLLAHLQKTFSAIANARFPVIAAIQGGCVGGGVDLATACCLRYLTDDAFFCIQEINLGVMADVGTMNRMPHLIPEAVMRELAYTGDRLPAARAVSLGFANGAFPTAESMMVHVMAVARRIVQKAPLAVSASKEMIGYSREHGVAQSLHYLCALQSTVFSLDDIRVSNQARQARSTPEYPDLPPLKHSLG